MKIAEIVEILDIFPHLRRISFYSPEFAAWPSVLDSAHAKVVIPRSDQAQPLMDKLDRKNN